MSVSSMENGKVRHWTSCMTVITLMQRHADTVADSNTIVYQT